MSARILKTFLVLPLFLIGGVSVAWADMVSDAAQRVRATHAALESAGTDFETEMAAGRLSESEQADYRRYLASLTERLRDHCREYQLAGGVPETVAGLCDIKAPAAPRAAAIAVESERTTGERIGDAEAELRAAMGEFDQTLLREQERLRTKGASGGGGGGGGAGSSGSTGSAQHDAQSKGKGEANGDADGKAARDGKGADAGTSEAQTDPEVTETVRGLPKSEGDSGETGQQGRRSGQSPKDGTGKGQGQGRGKGKPDGAPPGTPGGDDDDVIARQLREAAENETDPALRAKLWDEYRRYKDEQN
ncbi:MAG: hypothetical protein H6981_15045 [Gammaproteobacteria bacterium]|nr:hypothetical protein [Gammaproteobacteria bacterium]MCP5138102.1 hypothetical protein [Gammaproteobacteria bacterium]